MDHQFEYDIADIYKSEVTLETASQTIDAHPNADEKAVLAALEFSQASKPWPFPHTRGDDPSLLENRWVLVYASVRN